MLESRQFQLSYQRFQISSGNIKGRIDFLEISKTIGVLFIADLLRMEREEQYIHYLFTHLRAVYLGIWKATWGFFLVFLLGSGSLPHSFFSKFIQETLENKGFIERSFLNEP